MKHTFPTLQEVLSIHQSVIAAFGGAPGVRDMGALEAALLRPQLGYYQSLVEEAAALMESLAMNHPFVDGNKRVALYVTDTFLRLNGHNIHCKSDAAYRDWMRWFESGSFRFDTLAVWIQSVILPLSGGGGSS